MHVVFSLWLGHWKVVTSAVGWCLGDPFTAELMSVSCWLCVRFEPKRTVGNLSNVRGTLPITTAQRREKNHQPGDLGISRTRWRQSSRCDGATGTILQEGITEVSPDCWAHQVPKTPRKLECQITAVGSGASWKPASSPWLQLKSLHKKTWGLEQHSCE